MTGIRSLDPWRHETYYMTNNKFSCSKLQNVFFLELLNVPGTFLNGRFCMLINSAYLGHSQMDVFITSFYVYTYSLFF